MTTTRAASSGGAAVMALLVGGVVATVINALYVIFSLYLFLRWDQNPEALVWEVLVTLVTVVMGLAVAGPLLFTRPRGAVAPVLAIVIALVANVVGDITGNWGYMLLDGRMPSLDWLKDYFRYYGHLTAFGWFLLVLAPAVAAAVAALRVKTAGKNVQQQPVGGPWGAPQPPGAPYAQPPGAGYAAPGAGGPYAPPPGGATPVPPGAYGPLPGANAAPGFYGAPGQPAPAQPPAGQPPYPAGPGQPYPGQPYPGQDGAAPWQQQNPHGQPGQNPGQGGAQQQGQGSGQNPPPDSSQGGVPPSGG